MKRTFVPVSSMQGLFFSERLSVSAQTYGLELMLAIFEILQGVVGTIKLADRVVREMMGL